MIQSINIMHTYMQSKKGILFILFFFAKDKNESPGTRT